MTIPEALALGLRHHQSGQLAEAESIYRQILGVQPDHADALHLLGVIAHQVGRNDAAIEMIRRAIVLKPSEAQYYNSLGNALHRMRRFDESVSAYRSALEFAPDAPEVHANLGAAWSEMGNFEQAAAAYREALRLKPDFADAHSNLGNVLRKQGLPAEAAAACRAALRLKPDFAAAYINLGAILNELGQWDEAVAASRRGIELKPDDALACNNLGNSLKERAELDSALECYRRAAGLRPEDPALHSNVVYAALFHPGLDARALSGECARWQQLHGAPLERFIRPHGNTPEPGRRLRVGYVSPDFRHHVICHFLTPLLESHDHAQFEVFCYASVWHPDAVSARMKKCADVWRDVPGVSDEVLAGIIREDRIDILVDLTQHMAENRLPLFARKPAPVQVAWLGYPGSTGVRAIDYRFTDAWMEPEGSPWSESVEVPVRLPDSWFCFDPIDEYPEPAGLPALRAGHVAFGCLNNFCKANDAVLERWTRVLLAVPGSRLSMQCPQGAAQARVRQFFAARGIAAARLELVSWLETRAAFLELFRRIDIALDPFPYNGGTTTCEALWMGIPVLTLPGEMIVSRIGLSILSACGMPELVAHSDAEYVQLAASLAGDLARLAQLRATLRERMKASPFMDGPRFARIVEAAYRQMWQAWCAKQCLNKAP